MCDDDIDAPLRWEQEADQRSEDQWAAAAAHWDADLEAGVAPWLDDLPYGGTK